MLRKARETKLRLIQESNKRLLREYDYDTVQYMIKYVLKRWPKSKKVKRNSDMTIIELPNKDTLTFNFDEKEIYWDKDWALDSTLSMDTDLEGFEKWFAYN